MPAAAMKQARKHLLNAVILFILSLGSGCSDPNALLDHSTSIDNRNWGYVNDISEHVNITDNSLPCNLYFNVRVTGDYKYSNMFLLLHTSGPGIKPQVMRYELKLADVTGKWLGSGTSGLYSYQIPFKTNYRFPAKGTYHFKIEQNMRDNPLREVSDIGLRIERAK